MGKGLRKRKNGSSYDGRAVMTGPLLKLPLINALQPIEERRQRLVLNLSNQVFSHVIILFVLLVFETAACFSI